MHDSPYIGLISGTSVDGIDAVLVRFDSHTVQLVETHAAAYPAALRERLKMAIRSPSSFTIDEYGELDTWVGACFRDAALALLERSGMQPAEVRAVGSHGQTIRHRPDAEHRFTLQIGDPSTIATGTGIDTVADFRRADLALGGEAAPLVPPFHQWLFGDRQRDRAVLNLGGIANLTILPAGGGTVRGFDVGPANSLMDLWTERHQGRPFDDGGAWAATGSVDDALLDRLLADPWFERAPPKSTGFEYFNAAWLERHDLDGLEPEDVQATLVELTSASIANAIDRWAGRTTDVFVCGGGAHNRALIASLERRLPQCSVATTAAAGLDPDWVEATAFAWLAARTLSGRSGSLASVTGARRDAVLGGIYTAGSIDSRPG